MRKILFVLAALATFVSPAFAGPPCNPNVGGLCGADYDSWMRTWHRTNPGKVIYPASPGGYAIAPNGGTYYPPETRGQVVYGGGQVVVAPQAYGVQQGIPQGVPQVTQGPVTTTYNTVIRETHWSRTLTPEGWVCNTGPGTCPSDRAYIR